MLANLPPKRATRKVLQDNTLRTQGRLRTVSVEYFTNSINFVLDVQFWCSCVLMSNNTEIVTQVLLILNRINLRARSKRSRNEKQSREISLELGIIESSLVLS